MILSNQMTLSPLSWFFFHFLGKYDFAISELLSVYLQSFVLKYDDITIDSKSLLSEWQHLIDTNFCKSSILRQIDFGWFFIDMTKIFYLRKAGLYQWIFELFNKGYLSGFPTLSIYNLSFFLAETFHVKPSAKKLWFPECT